MVNPLPSLDDSHQRPWTTVRRSLRTSTTLPHMQTSSAAPATQTCPLNHHLQLDQMTHRLLYRPVMSPCSKNHLRIIPLFILMQRIRGSKTHRRSMSSTHQLHNQPIPHLHQTKVVMPGAWMMLPATIHR